MQVIAHRGWSEIAPENTHAAFAAALTAPCAGIELDLRLAADGTVVVCHDATLARFGGIRKPIAQQTLADLRQQCPVPTLAEVLDRYRLVELLLELKPHGGPQWTKRLLRTVCDQVRPTAVRERVLLLCFSPAVLVAAHALSPRLRLVRNTETLPAALGPWLAQHRHCWAIDAAQRAWTPAAVAATKDCGLRTAAYTVNRAADLTRCQRLGLDLVITNRPRWAHQRLASDA